MKLSSDHSLTTRTLTKNHKLQITLGSAKKLTAKKLFLFMKDGRIASSPKQKASRPLTERKGRVCSDMFTNSSLCLKSQMQNSLSLLKKKDEINRIPSSCNKRDENKRPHQYREDYKDIIQAKMQKRRNKSNCVREYKPLAEANKGLEIHLGREYSSQKNLLETFDKKGLLFRVKFKK